MEIQQFHEILDSTRRELAKVLIGQEEVVDQALMVIFCRQHALVEGVPGVAKTLLVRTLAQVLGCEFNRIQFTPDLMPADITGTHVFNLQDGRFNLIKGPVFTSFLLADEINRAPAKTQSALLQAMQERTVTIDRQTFALPGDFTVFATQNPIEHEGTYPLPEAQKDRFMLKIRIGFPEENEEKELARRILDGSAPERVLEEGGVEPILPPEKVTTAARALEQVTCREELVNYSVELVRRTRDHEALLSGAGPRATQSLLLAVRARAALDHRDFVTPDDVREMTVPVLEHRLVLRPEFEIEGVTVESVIRNVLDEVPVPR